MYFIFKPLFLFIIVYFILKALLLSLFYVYFIFKTVSCLCLLSQ